MPKYKNCLKRIWQKEDGDDYYGRTRLNINKEVIACKVEKDVDGNVIYPIIVTATLKILNLGTVEFER